MAFISTASRNSHASPDIFGKRGGLAPSRLAALRSRWVGWRCLWIQWCSARRWSGSLGWCSRRRVLSKEVGATTKGSAWSIPRVLDARPVRPIGMLRGVRSYCEIWRICRAPVSIKSKARSCLGGFTCGCGFRLIREVARGWSVMGE